jgi:hypothetical protein
VQVSVKLVVAVSALVLLDPLVDWLPLQPPDAMHDVALVEDQVKLVAAPLFTVLGPALRTMVGAALVTETVTDWVALPPAPVQMSP